MTAQVGIRELRQQASALVKRALAGESIEVTDHGRPVARLVPLRPARLDQLVVEGRATEAGADLLEQIAALGLPAAPGPGSRPPSEALAELRSSEV